MDAIGAIALAGTAIGLGKIFQTAEVRTDLNGTCVYGEPESPVMSPCVNVTVNLINEESRISASSSTNQKGDFRFYIPSGQSYFVQVIDRKGRSASTKIKAGRSQFVSLFLKP